MIPNVTPSTTVTRDDLLNFLLSSVALEELDVSNIVNVDKEKIQYALGWLSGLTQRASVQDVLNVNNNVQQALDSLLKKEVILENILAAPKVIPSTNIIDIEATEDTPDDSTSHPYVVELPEEMEEVEEVENMSETESPYSADSNFQRQQNIRGRGFRGRAQRPVRGQRNQMNQPDQTEQLEKKTEINQLDLLNQLDQLDKWDEIDSLEKGEIQEQAETETQSKRTKRNKREQSTKQDLSDKQSQEKTTEQLTAKILRDLLNQKGKQPAVAFIGFLISLDEQDLSK
jgi:ribosomal protein S13